MGTNGGDEMRSRSWECNDSWKEISNENSLKALIAWLKQTAQLAEFVCILVLVTRGGGWRNGIEAKCLSPHFVFCFYVFFFFASPPVRPNDTPSRRERVWFKAEFHPHINNLIERKTFSATFPWTHHFNGKSSALDVLHRMKVVFSPLFLFLRSYQLFYYFTWITKVGSH